MKIKFDDFINEIHRYDKQHILSDDISKLFTVAFEFELETDEEVSEDIIIDYSKVFRPMKTRTLYMLKSETWFNQQMKDFANDIFDQMEEMIEDDDIFDMEDELLEPKNYEGNEEKIIKLIQYGWFLYIKDDLNYLKKNVKKYLPKFYKKYNRSLKFELDASLERGIEFSPKKYVVGLNESIEMLNDFFEEFDNQEYWKFSDRTGLHINLGIKGFKHWNTIKGLLTINDLIDEKMPYVFKGIEYRAHVEHCQPLLKELINRLVKNKVKLDIKDPNLEEFLNEEMLNILKELGYKHFALNLVHLADLHYVEFRYVGGDVSKDLLIEKLIFFAYISLLMTDENYKKKEYQKRLYKFVDVVNNQTNDTKMIESITYHHDINYDDYKNS